jgi:solute carrier family 25 phosphate transporter 3
MATKQSDVPNFTISDYAKFFGAGALAATSTHGVSRRVLHMRTIAN